MGRKGIKSCLLGRYQQRHNWIIWGPIKSMYTPCSVGFITEVKITSAQVSSLLNTIMPVIRLCISEYLRELLFSLCKQLPNRDLNQNFPNSKRGLNSVFALTLSHICKVSGFILKEHRKAFKFSKVLNSEKCVFS